jgi:polygalacturonase
LKAGDTVYFNSSDTWTLSNGSYGFRVTGGVTYIGDTWGNGKRAKFDVTRKYNPAAVAIWEDHPTIETEFKGFEVDLNMTESFVGIQINNGSKQGWKTVGAIKRVENCHVHHTGRISSTYGIAAGTHHNSTTKNIEIIDCIVHDIGHNAICLYAGYRSNNALISDVVIRGCETYKTGLRSSYGGPAGIQIKNHVENVIVENNKLHNSDLGIKIYREYANALPIRNITIRYNEIAHNDSAGIYVYNGPSSDVYIYGNLIYKNGKTGITFTALKPGTFSYYIFNNTFYSNRSNGIKINGTRENFSALEIINNIFSGASTIYLLDLKNAITAHSNNLFHYASNSSKILDVAGKSYRAPDINKWESSAEIVHTASYSICTNVSKDDYSLTDRSPAIGKGTDLSSVFNEGLNSKSIWPKNVKRSEWSPGKWDIGAYVYGDSPPVVNLLPPGNLRITSN